MLKTTASLAALLMLAGCTSTSVVCGVGTRLVDGVCVATLDGGPGADATLPGSDGGVDAGPSLDADRPDGGPVPDTGPLGDAGSPDDRCDPNFYDPRCSPGGSEIWACSSGRIIANACPDDHLCNLRDSTPVCVPTDGIPCDPSFVRRCNDDRVEACNHGLGVLWIEDCGAMGLECSTVGGSPQCVGRDATPCDPATAGGGTCLDGSTLRSCGPFLGGGDFWQTWDCPTSRSRCVPSRPGIDAVCVPDWAELCDPVTYLPTCPTPQTCTTAGFLQPPAACPAGDECLIEIVADSSPPRHTARCRQPSALPCESLTYDAWCDGETTRVSCAWGYIRREVCPRDLTCVVYEEGVGVDCEFPEFPPE